MKKKRQRHYWNEFNCFHIRNTTGRGTLRRWKHIVSYFDIHVELLCSQFELWFIFFKLIQSSFVSWTCADESHSSYRHFCAINFWKKSISPLKTRVGKTSKWVEVHWNRLTKFTITFDWAAFEYFMRKRVIGKVVSVQFVDRSSTRVSGKIEVPILMFPLFDWFVARWFIVVNF